MSCAGNYFLEIEGTSTLYFPVLQLENQNHIFFVFLMRNAECECGYCVLFIIFEKGMCTATFTYDNFNSIDNSFLTQTKIINLAAY